MENPEEILHSLEEFSKLKPKSIPHELEEYLCFVAKTGDPVYQWSAIKHLFREKLLNVITEFYESCPTIDIPSCPNVDYFHYDSMKAFILEKLDTFAAAPFTVQRICELLTAPRKEYNRIDKYMRALEKNILVVSTTEPGNHRAAENGDGFLNGLESDHAQDSANEINIEEMDDTPVWPLTTAATMAEESVQSTSKTSEEPLVKTYTEDVNVQEEVKESVAPEEIPQAVVSIAPTLSLADVFPTTEDIPAEDVSIPEDAQVEEAASEEAQIEESWPTETSQENEDEVLVESDTKIKPLEPAEQLSIELPITPTTTTTEITPNISKESPEEEPKTEIEMPIEQTECPTEIPTVELVQEPATAVEPTTTTTSPPPAETEEAPAQKQEEEVDDKTWTPKPDTEVFPISTEVVHEVPPAEPTISELVEIKPVVDIENENSDEIKESSDSN